MEIKNREIWDKGIASNQDGYGARCFSYAKDWAELLEARIPRGASQAEVMKIITDHAEKDSHTADTDGITGFMYGMAVSILANCWAHGEELRRWHNLETQLGNEGEEANKVPGRTLNPAMLRIGK